MPDARQMHAPTAAAPQAATSRPGTRSPVRDRADAGQPPTPAVLQRLVGIVERITFQDGNTGWSVVKVSPFDAPHTRVTVTMHQIAVVPGATMELHGAYEVHPRFGEQFRCHRAVERKPASVAALERYLGSGLIRGVGPKTARAIVRHFGDATLGVLEDAPDRLLEVRGIAAGKLARIVASWGEHRSLRGITSFLQEHGVSTIFAARLLQRYGASAIDVVRRDPYRLARDIFGIGFFTADRVARSLGFAADGQPRIEASVRHVLDAAREAGHCWLSAEQVRERATALLAPDDPGEIEARIDDGLARLVEGGGIRSRRLAIAAVSGSETAGLDPAATTCVAYYARSLYRAETTLARLVAARVAPRSRRPAADARAVDEWLRDRAEASGGAAAAGPTLSLEQTDAIRGIVRHRFSILTGGPGCGKTTTLRALVGALAAAGRRVTLAAATGRAAQRLAEVTGQPARTVHRLLEWDPRTGGFRRGRELPLPTDFLVVDEVSMLDVSIAAALLSAVPDAAPVLFIGDPDQLPSVGPGRVLADLLEVSAVPRFCLSRVFRQAEASHIVRYAHAIRAGRAPDPWSPLADPRAWDRGVDCLFVDAEVATCEELKFIQRARAAIGRTIEHSRPTVLTSERRVVGHLRPGGSALGVVHERRQPGDSPAGPDAATDPADGVDAPAPEAEDRDDGDDPDRLVVPRRFLHVDLEALARSSDGAQELRAVLRRIHPDSAVHHGLTLPDAVVRLYAHTLPRRLGRDTRVQILAPMNRGSVGADALNHAVQAAVNPPRPGLGELRIGGRVLRVGDRVIQRRNDYDLGVFNGDIGRVVAIDAVETRIAVAFPGLSPHPNEPGAERVVAYRRDALTQLALAYAITIHKAQGSEFSAVILPIAMQHYSMLFRDLVYTALTRARRMAVFIGSRRALALAVGNVDRRRRQTALASVLDSLLR